MKQLRKLLPVALTLILVLGIAVGVLAEDRHASFSLDGTWYYIDADGCRVGDEEASLPQGVSYDLNTNTLTLTDASLTQASFNYRVTDEEGNEYLNLPNAGLTIKLVGENSISDATDDLPLCLDGEVEVTFAGDGSLRIANTKTAGSEESFYRAIEMWNADLTVTENVTLNVSAKDRVISVWNGGQLTVSGNAKVTAATTAEDTICVGLWGSTFYQSGGTVEMGSFYISPADDESGIGASTANAAGGTLTASDLDVGSFFSASGSSTVNVGWVNADGQVSVNGGTMTIADGYYIGGELKIISGSLSMPGGNYYLKEYNQYGGTVDVEAVKPEEPNEDGSYYWEGLTIRETGNVSGGALNFVAENGENDWINGLQVLDGGSLTISGGTVTSTVNRGNAVFVSGGSNLKVSGTGELNATVSGTDSAAVQLYGDMTVNGGSLTAEGEVACEVGNDRSAEGALGNLTVSDGVVNLNGTYRGLRIQDGAAVTLNGGQVNATGYVAVMMRNWRYDEYGDVLYQENPSNTEEGTWVPDLENPSTLTVTGGTHTFTGTNKDVTESLNAYYSKINIDGGTVNLRNSATEAGWALNCLSNGENNVLTLGEGIHAVSDTSVELTPVSESEGITWLESVNPYFVTFTTDNQPVDWNTPNLASNVTITTRGAVGLMGDLNGDGSVTAADAVLLAKHLIGLSGLDEAQLAQADLDGDGSITAADAVLLAKKLVGGDDGGDTPEKPGNIDLGDVVQHTDYTSVYSRIGANITVDMLMEDPETGLATFEYQGVTYEAGMDFLSMAMVYNCQPCDGYATAEACYNQWWKLYIQRWNYMMPQLPLYSNQYYDFYNAKLENFETNPYWSASRQAILGASVKTGEENSVILGGSTPLTGAFRNASWSLPVPDSADQDVQMLTTGYYTAWSDKIGTYQWDYSALAEEPTATKNPDGTLTYTIKLRDDMVFSDGSCINAYNYVTGTLANSTEVSVAADSTGAAGAMLVGFDEFKAYTGEGDMVYFEGIQVLDDYTFALTFKPEYANYYYAYTYAALAPDPLALYLGDAAIILDAEGHCGLNARFYEKNSDGSYIQASTIRENMAWNSDLPYSGPYYVEDYNEETGTATLKRNPNYPGDNRGAASIETITYCCFDYEYLFDAFQYGQIDILSNLSGAEEIDAARQIMEENPGKFAESHYPRAGYGKLAFRCDLGPTSDRAVRQAIAYTIDCEQFMKDFCGDYGDVVYGPYYEGMGAYLANVGSIKLNHYDYSVENAVKALEDGGWVYNSEGKAFVAGTDTVRYKKLSGYALSPQNLQYATVDGSYCTKKIGNDYYMPLAINYYGTQPNYVTDLLLKLWQTDPNATTAIGMYIDHIECDFMTGLYGEYHQMSDNGWDGVAKCSTVNFATGFNSVIYDYAYYWTIDPSIYAGYSDSYLMDEADFWENYHNS